MNSTKGTIILTNKARWTKPNGHFFKHLFFYSPTLFISAPSALSRLTIFS